MEAVLLARIQFAFTVGFHFLFPPLTIGLAWLLVWMMWKYYKTGLEFWKKTTKFWLKLFTISFALGVATGIAMEFQFGTNWSVYSRVVGDIFGAPLAAEGIFSFFLESTFLGVLLFGWGRVSKKVMFIASLMVAVGSTMSAFWIIVANSWMQTPAGYEMVDGVAQLSNFWAALFNPSTLPRYFHTIVGALTTGAFFMMGISAYYLLKLKKQDLFAKKSLALSLIVATAVCLIQVSMGHWSAIQVAHTQPEKLAAMEGLYKSQAPAPLKLFGIVDEENERTVWAIELPAMLTLMTYGDLKTEVAGLDKFPKDERPPVALPFYSFHIMVGLGFMFVGFTLWGAWLLWRRKLWDNKLWLLGAMFMIPMPFLANEFGWIAAEVGRQPWAVYKIIRTVDAVSISVPAYQVLISLILFGLVYALMFFLWIYLLRKEIHKGPGITDEDVKEVAQ